jgi:hypothetical protein
VGSEQRLLPMGDSKRAERRSAEVSGLRAISNSDSILNGEWGLG